LRERQRCFGFVILMNERPEPFRRAAKSAFLLIEILQGSGHGRPLAEHVREGGEAALAVRLFDPGSYLT
jgi:hypothetical protein